MSGKGCCYDNAACESFFGTLKVELVHDEKYKTREEAKSSIFEYIAAYYNTKRKYSTINYMTPNQFEDIMKNEVQNLSHLFIYSSKSFLSRGILQRRLYKF